jgi:hypothetical protein
VAQNDVDIADEVEEDDCAPRSAFFGPFSSCVCQLEVFVGSGLSALTLALSGELVNVALKVEGTHRGAKV